MQKLLNMIPLGRVTDPVDVAHAAWFLASNESSFITGTILEACKF